MSGSIGDAINGIVETAIKKNPPENGDYIGDDGLLYCGKCHTRRQFKMKWLDGQDRVFPVPCKCREEEAQRQTCKPRLFGKSPQNFGGRRKRET